MKNEKQYCSLRQAVEYLSYGLEPSNNKAIISERNRDIDHNSKEMINSEKIIKKWLLNGDLTARLNDEEELLSMSNINTQLSISLKTLVNLVSHANQIFESSNFDEKRKFLKILFSNFILDGKNPVFSIRKPVLTLVKTGSRPKWQST